MQTFLVYSDFHRSMECLDPKRLGNQVYREGLTILNGGWANHPAARMWAGHHYTLCEYLLAGLDVLDARGRHYPHHRATFTARMAALPSTGRPAWCRSRKFHIAHRSNLIRKDPEWYGPMWPDVPPDLPYIWPTP